MYAHAVCCMRIQHTVCNIQHTCRHDSRLPLQSQSSQRWPTGAFVKLRLVAPAHSLFMVHHSICFNISLSDTSVDHVMSIVHRLIEDRLVGVAQVLQSELEEVDGFISVCGQVLDLIQPRDPGRIEVKWWASPNGVDRGREPRLVELRSSRREAGKGAWYQKKISKKNLARRAKEKHDFALTTQEVRDVLELLAFLLDRREALLRLVGTFKTSANRMVRANEGRLPAVDASLRGIISRFAPYTIPDERIPGTFRLDTDAIRVDRFRAVSQARTTAGSGEGPEPSVSPT